MSIVDQSFFSHMKGSFGNVIVYEVNGQMRIRAKPGKYKKSTSDDQQSQRNKFRAAATFYSKIGVPMCYSWDEATRGKTMSGYNLFIKENIRHFTTTGEMTENPEIKVTYGPLYIPEQFEMQYTTDQITLEWNTEYGNNGSSQDLLQVAIYDEFKKHGSALFCLEKAETARSIGKCTFPIPPGPGKKLYLFAFFKSKFQHIFSNSRFVGIVVRD